MPPIKQSVLVTGGSGYIGSHTVLLLIEQGYDVVVLDNLSNSCKEAISRVEKLTGGNKITFHVVDLVDYDALDKVFANHKFNYVIHFAALKSVGDSVNQPIRYYENNIVGLLNLIKVMNAHHLKEMVFSSSCTVYGEPKKLPLTEDHPVGECANPYGASKFFSEVILKDLCKSDPEWRVVSLRYFNPVGAHPSGMLGEDPSGVPSNIMPYISQVAIGLRPHVNVFGNDYDTRDGTGVRDYIHIMDLAEAHIVSLNALDDSPGYKVYNLGTGNGYTVLELIHAMEKACGKAIAFKIAPRRLGDTTAAYADASLAHKELGWKTKFGIEQMCQDQWNWQAKNPNGFSGNSPPPPTS